MKIVTEHRPGNHRLYIDDQLKVLSRNEVELSRQAQKIGINFKEMDYESKGSGFYVLTTWRPK